MIQVIALWFDTVKHWWEKPSFIRAFAFLLILFYLGTLLLIGLKELGFSPAWALDLSSNPFKAIELAFTFLLFYEVISLVFSLEKSFSTSMIIQIEILSLILLRSAFKMFGDIAGELSWDEISHQGVTMFTDAFGSLILFAGIMLIKRFEKPIPICDTQHGLDRFINVKKVLSLFMLIIFLGLIVVDIVHFFNQEQTFNFFHVFYTILIFTDILIVLIALRYGNSYLVLYRNSGYALATVIMRLALGAPAPQNAILGILALVFVLAIVLVYNKLGTHYNPTKTIKD